MLIHYGNGAVHEGILLSLKANEMRVAIKDADDVAEFRMINDVWISENCEVVTFEFPLAVFEAIGMMPTRQNVNQPELFWQSPHSGDATADWPN